MELVSKTIAQFGALAGEVLDRIENTNTRSMYRKGLTDFLAWWRAEGRPLLDQDLVKGYLGYLGNSKYSPATINQRLAAIRKLVGEAADRNVLGLGTAAAIIRIAGVRRSVTPKPFGLSADQTESLINTPDPTSRKGLRDRALLALLVGCALRRGELVSIQMDGIQKREGRWVLLDVIGRGGRVRAVAVPQWAKMALDAWVRAAGIQSGPVFRALDRDGNVADRAISPQSVLPIVAGYGRALGLDVKPDDLRRTCAQLCRAEGGELEQIKFLLGHSSIQTTERYLGTKQNLADAPNDRVRMRWYSNKKLAS